MHPEKPLAILHAAQVMISRIACSHEQPTEQRETLWAVVARSHGVFRGAHSGKHANQEYKASGVTHSIKEAPFQRDAIFILHLPQTSKKKLKFQAATEKVENRLATSKDQQLSGLVIT